MKVDNTMPGRSPVASGFKSYRLGMAVAACLWLAGCAGGLGLFRAESTPAFRDAGMTMQNASDSVVAGTSTRSDVLAALGPAQVVRFDSGFEVWVYRQMGSDARAPNLARPEFVVLFSPSGIVRKTRIRRAPVAG